MRLRRELQHLKTHFELFGLAPAFTLDAARLDEAYRRIQAEVHPDRYAGAGEAERRASMQMTTQVNEAYRTLKNPVRRATYLLGLQGVDAGFETDTAMPADFLLRQIELREELEAAGDADALDALGGRLAEERRAIESELAARLDRERDFAAARSLVRKLIFFERLAEEVDAAHDRVN